MDYKRYVKVLLTNGGVIQILFESNIIVCILCKGDAKSIRSEILINLIGKFCSVFVGSLHFNFG